MAELMDGHLYARRLSAEVASDLSQVRALGGSASLATLMVGSDPRAAAYERTLRRAAGELGIGYCCQQLAGDVSQDDVLGLVGEMNSDDGVSGMLVLRPLPSHIDESIVFAAVDPVKDVEGVHPTNVGLLALGTPRYIPSTPASVFYILDRWLEDVGEDLVSFYRRSTIVVVGRSRNVGKPAMELALARQAVVISCDEYASASGRLEEYTRQADVLVVAAGVANLVRKEHVCDGAIVLDVGMNPTTGADGKRRFVGDVAFDEVLGKARGLTPVPGGVGPVTDVWLLRNVVQAAREINSLQRA